VVITDVRIKLIEANNERLLAYCWITLDEMFAVRDLKVVEGCNGLFVAMPYRKLMDRCRTCGSKNHLRAHFCNICGARLDARRAIRGVEGNPRLHADLARPMTAACREMIHDTVLKAYREEVGRAKAPGYTCRYDESEE
jgi:stage V sporulation protein G